MVKERFYQTSYLEGLELSELKFLDLFFSKNENPILSRIIQIKRQRVTESVEKTES
jgi:hypothetical protein